MIEIKSSMLKIKILTRTISFLFIVAFVTKAEAQNITLSGYIKDNDTKESLIGANVYSVDSKKGTSTNEYGFYSLTLPKKDTLNLVISYIGYVMQVKRSQ